MLIFAYSQGIALFFVTMLVGPGALSVDRKIGSLERRQLVGFSDRIVHDFQNDSMLSFAASLFFVPPSLFLVYFNFRVASRFLNYRLQQHTTIPQYLNVSPCDFWRQGKYVRMVICVIVYPLIVFDLVFRLILMHFYAVYRDMRPKA